jgi:YaiO family outer membrane protein
VREAITRGTALALLLLLAGPLVARAAETPLEHARALAHDGRLEESLAAYEQLIARDPQQREAVLGRARVLGWLGRYEQSLDALDAVLREDARDVETLVLRARVRGWTRDHAAAETDARRALALAPDSPEAHVVLGDVLSWSERSADARAAYEAALELAPDSLEAHEGLRRLRERRRPSEQSPFPRDVRLDLGLRYDSLDGDASDWWQQDLHVAFQALRQLRLYAGATQTRRYGNDDTQASLAASWAGAGGWWLGAGASVGPSADVVARHAFSLELAKRLGERVVTQITYRRAAYRDDVKTDAVSPGFELWPTPQVKLRTAYHFTHVTGNRFGHAGSLRLELLPDGRLSPYLAGALGSEAFAPSSVQGARSRARTASASAGVVWRFGERAGLRAGYAFEDLHDTYRRHGLETGLFVDF